MKTDTDSLWENIRGTDEERLCLQEILEDGEQLLWLGRPKADAGAAWRRLAAYLAGFFIFPVWIWAFLCAFNLPALLRVILILCSCGMYLLLTAAIVFSLIPQLRAASRNVYAVTNRRSISLTWALFFYKRKAWPAQEYLGIMHRKDGTGDIIYENQQTGACIQVDGLFSLPDVDTVAALTGRPPTADDEGDYSLRTVAPTKGELVLETGVCLFMLLGCGVILILSPAGDFSTHWERTFSVGIFVMGVILFTMARIRSFFRRKHP